MEIEDETSILTDKHRNWLNGTGSVAHTNTVRGRIQRRLRAAIANDSELIAEALEDGRLNADTVGNNLDFHELGDGISAFVAALYRVADECGLDAERTIQKGIQRGEEGRIARIERKLEEEGVKELTLGELMDLRSEKPEYTEKLNRAEAQHLSDTGILPTGMGNFDELPEEFESDSQ